MKGCCKGKKNTKAKVSILCAQTQHQHQRPHENPHQINKANDFAASLAGNLPGRSGPSLRLRLTYPGGFP